MNSYFPTTPAADAIAATLPASLVAAYVAASAANNASAVAALLQASSDVDGAIKYQGRKYDPTQLNEFPRIAREPASMVHERRFPVVQPAVEGAGMEIWDYDWTNNVPVVPPDVLAAVVYQANSILLGDRDGRQDAIHDGVASQGAEGVQESYRDPRENRQSFLCRRAFMLMARYRLMTGRYM
jgi:hypothetical protein